MAQIQNDVREEDVEGVAPVLDVVRSRSNDDYIRPEASAEFVITPFIEEVIDRACVYLQAGYAVHLSGVAGIGKTTLAFHIAATLGRPVSLIHGDDEFKSSDLVGNDSGYSKRRLVDNYISSVMKTEEEMKSLWVDNRLTTACKNGDTLIYDEFTRSRPEANNALLSVLSEGILNMPRLRNTGQGYMRVHPNFRAIFTSNPEEYVGTHKIQDALLDRMITIQLDHYDRETEVQITMTKSGVSREDAEVIVDTVREVRSASVTKKGPSIRACIAIARILVARGAHAQNGDPVYEWVVRDVLGLETARVTRGGTSVSIDSSSEPNEELSNRGARFSSRKSGKK